MTDRPPLIAAYKGPAGPDVLAFCRAWSQASRRPLRVVTVYPGHAPIGMGRADAEWVTYNLEEANRVVGTLRKGGRMVDLTGSVSVVSRDVRVDREYVVRADGDRLSRVARMIDDGWLKVEIQEFFPFERAPDSLKVVQAKHVRGKIVLRIA